MQTDRDVFLSVRSGGSQRPGWLTIDLGTGEHVRVHRSLEDLARQCPGCLVAVVGMSTMGELDGGGAAFPDTWLWSLVDPLDAGHGVEVKHTDEIEDEAILRQAVRRLRGRLVWWGGRSETLKQSCRDLLGDFAPFLPILLDWLDQEAQVVIRSGPLSEAGHDSGEVDSVESTPSGSMPTDPAEVFSWFQEAGEFGRHFGREFQPRPQQAEMARAVAQALESGRALLVEAGTGVGKTLAYLVPLLARIKAEGSRGIVATHTRALQKQILEHDLPRLGFLVGDKKYALLMGRRHYLCRRQRDLYLSRPVEHLTGALQAVSFRLWLTATSNGMRDELAGHPLLRDQLGALFDGPDLCLPGYCFEEGKCFVQMARKMAREADILVVNHALLIHDLRTGHGLMGEFSELVVDEAHRLPDVALEAHAVRVGTARMRAVGELLGREGAAGGSVADRVKLVAHNLESLGPTGEKAAANCLEFGVAEARAQEEFHRWWLLLGQEADASMASARTAGRFRIRDKDETFGPLRAATSRLTAVLAESCAVFSRFADRTADLEGHAGNLEDDLAQLGQAGQLLRQIEQDIEFLTRDPDEAWVTWLDLGIRRGVSQLGATRLESGPLLRNHWLESSCRPVMTSATLAIGEDFSHMMAELGLTRLAPPTLTCRCLSPFDYHERALFLVPKNFPAPGDTGFGQAIGALLLSLCREIPRKTLTLFTSYRLIEEVSAFLEENGLKLAGHQVQSDQVIDPLGQENLPQLSGPEPGMGLPQVFVQSKHMGAPALLESFRRSRQGLLLGAATFWEGVDFPGDNLEILIVTRLPFRVPTDPWVQARCERIDAGGENSFTDFMVRDAVLRLRQGFGRLLRRESDQGIIVILDNRLHAKNYGTTFLNALPVVPGVFADDQELVARGKAFFDKGTFPAHEDRAGG